MSRVVDNLLAFRILYMLVTPFQDTDAYKLGVVDKEGTALLKSNDMTSEQKAAYSYLHRLVFKLKKLLNKLPGGESKLKNIVAALWLIKENYESDSTSLAFLEEKYQTLVEKLDTVTLVEEEILVNSFFEVLNEDGVPANSLGSNGAGVALDMPFRRKKKFQSFTVNDDIYRRFKNGKSKYRQWNEYLNLEDEGQRAIYDYARKNPKAIIVLKNGTEMKAIRFNRNGGGKWSKIKRQSKQINTEVV